MPTIPSWLASLLLGMVLSMPAAWAFERPFAVITAPGATARRVTHESVSLIFRRKQNYWESGTRIQPVNLPPTHSLRRAFSQAILGHPPEAMEDYWREMYFHGVLPPHVLASEEAVVIFVSATPGAIGYVSVCVPENGVDVVLMVGELPTCPR
jgi:ABC-type phosphate transport system substrate-binding protein